MRILTKKKKKKDSPDEMRKYVYLFFCQYNPGFECYEDINEKTEAKWVPLSPDIELLI